MKITYAIEGVKIEAAADGGKSISGLVAPFGKIGATSAGRVRFEPMAFAGIEPSNVVLLVEHDNTRPIGRMTSYEVTPGGVTATFRVADTTAGRDELINAAEGLRSGLSVGANIKSWENMDGVMSVTSAELVEVSLVTNPAFSDARVSDVAASEAEAEPQAEETTEAETPTETEENQLTDQTAPAVEAAAPVVEAAAAPVAVTTATPRLTASDLTTAAIRAARGDHSAITTLTAAISDADTSGNPGVIPVALLQDVINTINGDRPFINSINRAPLMASGMTFRTPRWSAYPTVAAHTEGAEPASSPATIDDILVNVVSRMGANKFSIELFDRSEPGYYDQLRRMLAVAYAINTDTAALETFIDNAQSTTGTSVYDKLVDGVSKVYTGTKRRPDRLLVAVDAWADLMKVVDGEDRPLFAPINVMNGAGTLAPFAGNILGLDVVVDHNAPSGTCVVYGRESARYFEMAGSPAFLQAVQIGTAEIELAIKGYDALALDYQFEIDGDDVNLGAAAVTL